MRQNKRGETGDMLMFSSFIFLILIIAGGVVAEVFIFFGDEYDFRGIDASLLNYKTINCVSDGKIDILKIGENFFDKCAMDRKVMEENKLLVQICKGDGECFTEKNPIFSTGGNFEVCKIKGAQANKNFMRCSEGKITINGESYTIVSASNQAIKYRSAD